MTNEFENSSDIFTTLVRIKGSDYNVVPVKSTKPIEKRLWIDCSKALSRLYVGAPISIGDIVCQNLLNTGVDIVCTKNMKKKNKTLLSKLMVLPVPFGHVLKILFHHIW
jgi:CxxC motif-containing protein